MPETDDIAVAAAVARRDVPSGLPKPAQMKLLHLQAIRDDLRLRYEADQTKFEELRAPDAALAVAIRERERVEKTDFGRVALDTIAAEQTPLEEQEKRTRELREKYEPVFAKVDALQAEVDHARERAKRRGDAWQQAAKLVTNIEEFLSAHPGQHEAVAYEPPKLAKGQDIREEVGKLRDLIAAQTAERRRIASAAIPASEAKQRLRSFVMGRAAKVRVGGLLSRDNFISVGMPQNDQAFNVACFLDPDAVIRRLEKEIDAQLENRQVLSELEQAKELKKIDDKLLRTARKEEALIVLLEQDGVAFARRPSADPRAVLGIA